MADTILNYTGDGIQTEFPITFPYLDPSHVEVAVDAVETEFSISSGNAVVSPAPSNGAAVRVSRNSGSEILVDYTAGVLTEEDLDLAYQHSLFIAAEARDRVDTTIALALDGKMDAQGRIIKNVADPEDAQDATTKNYVDTAMSSQVAIATAEADAAEVSAGESEDSAIASDISRVASENARDAAQTAKVAAEDARDDAQTAKAAAEAAQDATEDARDTALSAASDASGYATAASGSASSAEAAKINAEAARDDAETAKDDAENAKDAAVAAKVATEAIRDDASSIVYGTMNVSTYDPNSVEGDAFDMSNMVEGADAKIMTATERAQLSTAYGWGDHSGTYEPLDSEILRADTNDNLTAGYTATSDSDGTKSSGTYTPTPSGGNFKHITNGGSFTLAAPTASGVYTMVIEITNNGSAGTITMSGFDIVDGDDFDTSSGNSFQVFITKTNGGVTATVKAMQ